ncbi:IS630 family transposase, partial [Streptosporangium canum]|uniref:IS630 family transposase n=1 Tax=Streptosporangium canum TaxID=324952 RepID=UPI00341CBB4F
MERGRPPAISEQARERICLIARTVPAEWGLSGMSTWSLKTLAGHLVTRGVVAAISRERLRRILRKSGVSRQTTTTWKASTDPHFIAEMRRVLELYDHPPVGGRVICLDEFGPLSLMPSKGRRWRPTGSPARLRATCNRCHGVMQMIAALDLATGRLYYRIRKRKRWREVLSFLKSLRTRWPGEKLYVIADNHSPHKHPEVRAWAAGNDVELVFLPTYGSWLNWIESEFAALRYYALNGTDHRSHDEQNAAIGAYVRRRNVRAQPKANFAAGSPVRSWTGYP